MTLGEESAVGGMRSFHVDAGNRESSGIKRFGVGEDGFARFSIGGRARQKTWRMQGLRSFDSSHSWIMALTFWLVG